MGSIVSWMDGIEIALWTLGIYSGLSTGAWITFMILWIKK